jgi:peptidoglycan-associated lipoprotein
MRGLKSVASIAALVLLAACSTVKLDDQAPVEDRVAKSNAPASGTASSSIPGSGAKASGPKDAAKDAAAREAAAKEAAANEAAAREAAARDAAAAAAKDPLNDPASILANRSVYFDFDSFAIRDEFKAAVEAHGKFLAGNPNRKVVIQGHTDERGGSEYNLALGQKRAEAVRRALSLAGAKDSQMEAVSFGKEKPKATGSNEEAWSQNRRADIAY